MEVMENPGMKATVNSEIDAKLKILDQTKQKWADLEIGKRIDFLKDIREKTGKFAKEWVKDACRAKGIDLNSPLANEEWLSGPFALLYSIDLYLLSLKNIKNGYSTYRTLKKFREREDGQLIVRVFPHNFYYWLILNGIKAEVWMQPGIARNNLKEKTAKFYQESEKTGKTGLVLGAGNIASIPPLDALYLLFAQGKVVILKMNPVNEYLGPIFEKIFSSLISEGYLYIIYGGANTGSYITKHPSVQSIHLTGSEHTFNTIVFGSGEEGKQNRLKNQPILQKEFSAELGGVGPTIVVPGPWTAKDIEFQCENMLIQKLHNASFNCIASQILVTSKTWDKTPILLAELKKQLKRLKHRKNYYPKSDEKIEAILNHYRESHVFETGTPVSIIEDLPHDNKDEFSFKNEFFSPVWGQTNIPGENAEDFLINAVQFCNHNLHGSLAANIIIHPKTQRDLGNRFEEILSELKYGSIGVNIWVGGGFLLTQTPWGAFPGEKINSAQSGIGTVHNTFFFDETQKSIVSAAFYPFPRGILHGCFSLLPKPPWFRSHKKGHIVCELLTEFQYKPGFIKLLKIIWSAVTG